MKGHVFIWEFVSATPCILKQSQVKPELSDSPQLVNRDITSSIGVPIDAKLIIARLSFERHVPTLRHDSIFLAIGLIVWPNYVMLSFLEGNLCPSGRSKLPT